MNMKKKIDFVLDGEVEISGISEVDAKLFKGKIHQLNFDVSFSFNLDKKIDSVYHSIAAQMIIDEIYRIFENEAH